MPGIPRVSWDRALFVSVLAWTFLLCCTPMKALDIWWHLRTGQLMVEQLSVPWVDWYTFTEVSTPWIDLHWGFQLLAAAIYRLGGVPLLILAKATVTTLAIGIAWSATGKQLPVWMKTLCWLPAVIAVTGRCLVRPEALSLLFLAAWLWLLPRIADRPRLIWLLTALQLAWVNCHGLYVLGLIAGVAAVCDYIARSTLGGRCGIQATDKQLHPLTLTLAIVLTAVACLCNPYFEAGALFPLELYRKFSVDQAYYAPRIEEFKPALVFLRQHGLRSLPFDAGLVLWLTTLLTFVALARRRSLDVYRLLLFTAFSYLGWEATRNWNISAVVCSTVLCGNFEELRRTQTAETPSAVQVHRTLRLTQTGIALMGVLACVHLTGFWGKLTGDRQTFGVTEARNWYVHGAAQFAGQPGMPTRALIANIGQAAVYIFHNAPEGRVWMDGRLEVCSRQTFETYQNIRLLMRRSDPSWMSIRGVRDANGQLPVIILDSRYSRSEIDGLVRTPGWRPVFADAAGAVFVDDAVATRLGLPPADPTPLFNPDG